MKNQTGSALVSALVASGISMATLMAVVTMIQYSQKAGQGAQGVSEFGTLVDSVRTLVASPDSCKSAFVDAGGNPVVLPSPTAIPGTVVEAGKIVVGGSSILEKDEKLSAITVSKIELTRLKSDPSLLALRIFAQKKAGALGKQELEQSKPIFIKAEFGATGNITACSSGSGLGGPAWQDVSLTGTDDFDPQCQYRVKLGLVGADANPIWYGAGSAWAYFSGASTKYIAVRPVEGQVWELYGMRSTNKNLFGYKNGSTGTFTVATNVTVQQLQTLCQDAAPATTPPIQSSFGGYYRWDPWGNCVFPNSQTGGCSCPTGYSQVWIYAWTTGWSSNEILCMK